MYNLPEPPHEKLMIREADISEQRQQARIEDYLDNLSAPLIGIVPYAERQGIRGEAADHLYALIEQMQEEGLSAEGATEAALRAYGQPSEIGRAILDTWCRSLDAQRPMQNDERCSTLRAFACCAVVSTAGLLLVQAMLLFSVRQESFSALVFVYIVVSSLLAGVGAGQMIHTRCAQAVFCAMAIVLLHHVIAGMLMWPHREGLYYTLLELVIGLPVSIAAAKVTQSWRRFARRRMFWLRVAR
jgi:hypothetical protein